MRSDAIDWLLEEDNSPVRYFTLTHLQKKSPRSREVRQAKARLMDYNVTQGILAQANQFWGDEENAYRKYTGGYWQLIFLGKFRADGKDPRIAGGAGEMLARWKWVSRQGGQCLTANILAAAMRLGFRDHPIVQRQTEALAKRIVADKGIDCHVMNESLLPGCYMALPKLLLCFAEVPPAKRSKAVSAAIQLISRNLVDHEVHMYVPGNRKKWLLQLSQAKSGRPKDRSVKDWMREKRREFVAAHGAGEAEPKKGWLKFAFPLHYNSDTLEAMFALAAAGAPMHNKLRRPLEVVQQKMTPDGRWLLDNSLNGKMRVDVEVKGKPSKWLTYRALSVLEHFGN